MGLDDNNYNNNVNADNHFNNDNCARSMAYASGLLFMRTYNTLWRRLCSWDNLESAYWKARRRKSSNRKVRAFDEHWRYHIAVLMNELRLKTYKPKPLSTFVLRDPKTRVISVADFRDRVVHHALINVLQPIFEPRFIEDSFANRKGRGTLKALDRFDFFKRKLLINTKMRGGTSA